MPVYNGEKYIGEAIGSILAQTERDFELLVVDDGSTDKTVEVVSSFKDDRVKYFKRSHEGLVMALNFALGKANSKYIARMDADDVAYPERFEKQLKYITANNLAVCGSWADLTDEDGDKIGELKFPPITAGAIRYYAILHNPFIHPTVIFDKDIIMKAGAYRNFKNVEDYELWTRIIFKNNVGNIPERLIRYRLHCLQVTRRKNKLMKASSYLVRLYALRRRIFRI